MAKKPAAVISELVPLLIDETISTLQRKKLKSPLARIKMYYYDTCAPCCYLQCNALTIAKRQELLDTTGPQAISEIWRSDEGIEFTLGLNKKSPSFPLMATLYEMLSAEDNATLTRRLATELSIAMNRYAWPETLSISDDFVAYPTNGTDHGCYVYEDFCKAIPAKRRALLTKRELLGKDNRTWDRRVNFPTLHEYLLQIEAKIQPLPRAEQLQARLEMFDELLSGERNLNMMGVKPSMVLDRLRVLTPDCVMPLLQFVVRWSKSIDTWASIYNRHWSIDTALCEALEVVQLNIAPSLKSKRCSGKF